jgi:hypothetical protein
VDFGGEDEEKDDEDDIQEEEDLGIEDNIIASDALRDSHDEIDLDNESHQILDSNLDPVQWKTELERVGPKLRAQQNLATNEWRSHVDQTITNKIQIEKVLGETDNDLKSMEKYIIFLYCNNIIYMIIKFYSILIFCRDVSDELSRMKTKESYINKQFALLCSEFKEVSYI